MAGMMRILRPTGASRGWWFEESVDLVQEFEVHLGYSLRPVVDSALATFGHVHP
jgi:hypothetical protein